MHCTQLARVRTEELHRNTSNAVSVACLKSGVRILGSAPNVTLVKMNYHTGHGAGIGSLNLLCNTKITGSESNGKLRGLEP